MIFNTSLSLSLSVLLSLIQHLLTLPSLDHSSCHKMSSFSLLITWPKTVAWHLYILFMGDLVVSASFNTISFDFFAVHEICSILRRNHILLPQVYFLSVLKLSRQCIHTSEWVQYSTLGFFLCESRCDYLLVLITFSENSTFLALFLMQFQICCEHHFIFKYPSI